MKTRLDAELVRRGLARSREAATDLIAAGNVLVGGMPASKSATQVDAQTSITLKDDHAEFVSRGGHKLAGALDKFSQLLVSGKTALDAGASTGGFTDVLLRHGASRVVAIDVGHDQLAPELLTNPRVLSFEGINAREVTMTELRELTGIADLEFQLVVADLSFISVTLVLPALVKVAPTADFVLLIKPQFEVGKQSLSASGIVSDHRLRAQAIKQVVDCCNELGLGVLGLERSELPGTHGNIEYLIWVASSERPNQSKWNERIEKLAREGK
jgi:23S rRNA (cytidine1920-2'-O)/16S rRNA (cytidine1409-2'-O)-methyltransferase